MQTSDGWDAKLWPFLNATPEGDDRRLDDLVTAHIQPVVARVVQKELQEGHTGRSSRGQPYAETQDLIHDALSRLIPAIRDARENPDAVPIRNLEKFAVETTYNCVHEYLRRRYPHRRRIYDTLRYTLNNRKGFALWKDRDGDFVAGLDSWKEKNPDAAQRDRLQQLLQNPFQVVRDGWNKQGSRPEYIVTVLPVILRWLGGPVPLDGLISVFADLLDEHDRPTEMLPDDDYLATQRKRATEDSLEAAVIGKLTLIELWNRIRQLRRTERYALLLGAQSPDGFALIELLELYQIARDKEIAECLELSPGELMQLRNDLPLADARIAERLGVTPAQVRTLRYNVRRRLEQASSSPGA